VENPETEESKEGKVAIIGQGCHGAYDFRSINYPNKLSIVLPSIISCPVC